MGRRGQIAIGPRRMWLTCAQDRYFEEVVGKDWSKEPFANLIRSLPPAPTCIDVGANIGVTVLVAAAIRPDARIFAFEPVPSNARLLRQNLQENGIENCTVVECAVGHKESVVQMNNDGPWASVGGEGSCLSVPILTLDSYVAAELSDRRIDFLKIDVEGYEPNVLAGAAELIGRWRPLIFLEFNSWTLTLQGNDPIGFASFLWQAFDLRDREGCELPEPLSFVHRNMTGGCVDDLVLRLRSEAQIPSNPTALADRDTERRLREEIKALRSSTSWRATAPLRAVKHALLRAWPPKP
jgi:FkbM family methyltransferase